MLAILTSSAAAGSAGAQTVVVVGTRTPESLQRSTIRTGVVTRDEAERRGARNVGEALAGEASLQVNPEAYGYLGRPAGAQMQGLDAERVLVLEDGERVNGDVGGVVDLSRLSLTDVERIEYVTGPTSSLYGTNALGGVINVVTAPPRPRGLSGRGRFEGRSRGDLLAETSVAFRRDDDWAVADFALEHSPAAPLGLGRVDTLIPRIDGRTLGLRLGTTLHRRAELRLKLRWVHDELWGLTSEQVPGLGVYLVDLPGTTDRVTARAQESLRLSSRARLDFSLGRSWYGGESRRDHQSSPVDEARRRDLDTQSFESVLTLEDGSTRTWIFGVRSDTEQFAQALERTEVSSGALHTNRTPEVARTQLASGALFAQLAWHFESGLTLLPGVRGELHDRYGGILAPRLAVAARPSEKVCVRAAFGRGFRAPSAKEYGFVFDHSAIGYRVLGNPALHPERSWGATVDVTYKPWRELLLRAGAFGNRVSQLIGTDLAPDQPDPGITDYTYVNVSRAKTAGADAQLKWRLHERYGLEGGYAYLWTRDDSTGEPLPNRPSHTVTLALDASPSSRVQGTLRYRWVAPAFVATDVRSPGFQLLDARVALRVWRDVQVYSGVSNLLDQKKDPGLLGDARPALGRSIYLGVRGNLPGSEEGNDAPN